MSVQTSQKLILLGIVLLTVAVFMPVINNGLVNWDDPAYIQQNDLIKKISLDNTKTIFTSFVNGNYHPLTIFSLNLEAALFGINPRVIHGNNLILHVLNVVFVFLLISKLTRARGVALGVALLFAIHPMRVESVAWACERKDVLFGFFYLLALNIYIPYMTAVKGAKRLYTSMLVLSLLALLAKPTAMSLPVVLCLIDFYRRRPLNAKAILEKIPFFMFSLIFGLIAILGTRTPHIDVMPMAEAWPIFLRKEYVPYVADYNLIERGALLGYSIFQYIKNVFFVTGLSCYYPNPIKSGAGVHGLFYLHNVVVVILMGMMAFNAKKGNIIFFGVGFFLATIFFNLPIQNFEHFSVLGDRFTYIPYIGLFYLLVELLRSIYTNVSDKPTRILFVCTAIGFILFLGIQTRQRCYVWRNSASLWTDAIKKYPDAPMPYFNRGNYFIDRDNHNQAIRDYTAAIGLNPRYYEAYVNRGVAFANKGRLKRALEDYDAALRLRGHETLPRFNKIYILLQMGNKTSALKELEKIIEMFPDNRQALELIDELRNP